MIATPPSAWAFWREILLVLAAYGALLAVVVRAVAKDQFVTTFERCKDEVIALLNREYKVRDDRIERAVQRVDVHEDRLEGIDASVVQQGRALAEQVAGHYAQTTATLQAMTLTLGAIQEEAKATAVELGEIRGELRSDRASWDGTERRRHRRRRKSSET